MVIGVSHYQNGVLNKPDLRYPAKDAEDFASGTGRRRQGMVRHREISSHAADFAAAARRRNPAIHSATAASSTPPPNRQNILAALQGLQDYRRVKSTDILVVYLAGHGVSPATAGERHFYFPPAIATPRISTWPTNKSASNGPFRIRS